ncbi:MAG TPA: hypothetical protein VEO54_11920 [Thermoanaerobaculia bacterium]|nr:hypothetical protein [Thermoanaerobaculia bacterium]
MRFSGTPDAAIGAARKAGRVAVELAELPLALLLSIFHDGRGRRDEPASRREELRADIRAVRQLLRTAVADGLDKDLATALNFLARHGEAIRRAVIVWIDLIEVLVQDAERRYGGQPGKGALKAAEVKEVVRYLMRDRSFAIPDVPRHLQPVIIDLVVDWSIDVLVLMANRYGLWVDGTVPRPHSLFSRFRAWLGKKARLLFAYVLYLYGRIRQAFQTPVVISPEVKAAVEALEREGLIVSQEQFFRGIGDLLVWVSSRRRTLLALVEVVSTAVQEAEGYLSMSGPEKRAYTRDLVLAVLDELGFEHRTGLLFAIIDSTIYTAIEGSVHLFNKRGLFSHRS